MMKKTGEGRKMGDKRGEFVGSFDVIRDILRDIFIYGCFTVDDFENKGISASKYNRKLKKFKDMFDENCLIRQTINGKKAYYLKVNMFEASYNYLFDSYTMKTFTNPEMKDILLLMQIFSKSDVIEISQQQIKIKMELIQEDENVEIVESNLNRRLVYLNKIGFINKNKGNGSRLYKISNDILYDINEAEILKLMQAVDLMRNTLYPGSCGNFLFETLKRYVRRMPNLKNYRSPFLIKHNHYGQVLDDEILWILLQAIEKKKYVTFDIFESKKAKEMYEQVLPVKIFADEVYGRRFVLTILSGVGNKTKVFRLDRIKNIKIEDGNSNEFGDEILTAAISAQNENSITGGCDNFDGKIYEVKLRVHTSVIEYVKDEFSAARIEKINKEQFQVIVMLNNPTEIKPWLRKFINFIKVEKSDEHNLAEIMEEDLEMWRNVYGSL